MTATLAMRLQFHGSFGWSDPGDEINLEEELGALWSTDRHAYNKKRKERKRSGSIKLEEEIGAPFPTDRLEDNGKRSRSNSIESEEEVRALFSTDRLDDNEKRRRSNSIESEAELSVLFSTDRLDDNRKRKRSDSINLEEELSAIFATDQLECNKKRKTSHVRTVDLSVDDPSFLAEKRFIEDLLDYKFNSPELIREAMYCSKNAHGRLPGGRILDEANYPLAQVGDSALRLTLLDYMFKHEPRTIGATENRLQEFITDKNLAVVAEKHGISALIRKRYPAGSISRDVPGVKSVATTVEAIIGAVWYDSARDILAMRRILAKLLGVTFEEST